MQRQSDSSSFTGWVRSFRDKSRRRAVPGTTSTYSSTREFSHSTGTGTGFRSCEFWYLFTTGDSSARSSYRHPSSDPNQTQTLLSERSIMMCIIQYYTVFVARQKPRHPKDKRRTFSAPRTVLGPNRDKNGSRRPSYHSTTVPLVLFLGSCSRSFRNDTHSTELGYFVLEPTTPSGGGWFFFPKKSSRTEEEEELQQTTSRRLFDGG